MKKQRSFQDLTNHPNKKMLHYLKESSQGGKALVICSHGLGDAVEFLSLFEMSRKECPNWDLYFGFHDSLDFSLLHPKAYPITEYNDDFTMPFGKSIVQIPYVLQQLDEKALLKKFDYIFVIQLYDYKHPINPHVRMSHPKPKLEMAKVLEFGFPESRPIEKYKIPLKMNNLNSKNVGFHCDGNTDKFIKTPTMEEQRQIWEEIKRAGFQPIDIHLNSRVTISNSKKELPDFIRPEESIRNSGGGLSLLLDRISTFKYMVGILSGPLHLSNSILEEDKCIGLQKGFTIDNYIMNSKMNILDINKGFTPDSVYNILSK